MGFGEAAEEAVEQFYSRRAVEWRVHVVVGVCRTVEIRYAIAVRAWWSLYAVRVSAVSGR